MKEIPRCEEKDTVNDQGGQRFGSGGCLADTPHRPAIAETSSHRQSGPGLGHQQSADGNSSFLSKRPLYKTRKKLESRHRRSMVLSRPKRTETESLGEASSQDKVTRSS